MKQLHNIRCGYILTFILLALTMQVSRVFSETYTVNNHQIEVTLVPDKPAIMLGEATYISFIVQNLSDIDLAVVVGGDYRNRLGRPESFTVAVTDEDGKSVFQPDAGMSMGGLMGPQKLPAKGNYIFKLFLPNWATFKKTGEYSISASRDLQIVDGPWKNWFNTEKASKIHVQANTKITVIPYDRQKMGEIIAVFGERMLGNKGDDSRAAARLLSSIDDTRVIPYFVNTFKTRKYELIFQALNALTKFNNETAFQALKKGIEIEGQYLMDGEASVSNIRLSAAYALGRSPYPDAISFLLTKRHDKYSGVRLVVVQTASRLKSETAIPILQEMSNDEDKQVSGEATRYLKLFAAKTD